MTTWTADTPPQARQLLEEWLAVRVSPDAIVWLREKARPEAVDRDVFMAFALASRKVGKADLTLTHSELAEATRCRPGWEPQDWSLDQAARLYLLLSAPDATTFRARLEKLFVTADVGEQVTLCRGLPIYPEPEALRNRAIDCLRTNIKAVFEAVAHHNPYPAEFFDEAAWNQMVLKALFVGSRLDPIQRLDERANPTLANTLRAFAHERWAAHRLLDAEHWRCVGPFTADDEAFADLERAWRSPEASGGKSGLALALATSPHARAAALLAEDTALSAQIAAGALTWDRLPSL